MSSGLPQWAEFFQSAAQLERFEGAVIADFDRRGMRIAIEDGWVIPMRARAERGEGGENAERWGLSNVGQRCAAAEEKEWAGIIAGHFDAIMDPSNRVAPETVEDYEAVRERLALRLWDVSILPNLPEVKHWTHIPGLVTVLCLDLPNAIQSIREDAFAKWGRDEDEVFNAALGNTRQMVSLSAEHVDFGGQVVIALSSESVYGASLALDVSVIGEHAGRHGAIVSMPVRNLILVVPLTVVEDLQRMAPLLFVTRKSFDDGPGSVSPRVYWNQGERWIEIPYELTKEGPRVTPPPEFVEVMEKLARKK